MTVGTAVIDRWVGKNIVAERRDLTMASYSSVIQNIDRCVCLGTFQEEGKWWWWWCGVTLGPHASARGKKLASI